MRDPKVLIVGAGPAGLAAAAELTKRGVSDILIIDRDDAPGGLPRFCAHPGFGIGYSAIPRFGPEFSARLVRAVEDKNVRILCSTTMTALDNGPAVSITGPECGYRIIKPRTVILATGIREANRGNRMVPGDRPEAGVLTTGLLQQMVARSVPFPAAMKSIVVVGTEHVSFSAIWTAHHAGLKVRMMVDDGPRISSFRPVGWLAKAIGIDIRLRTHVAAIKARDNRVSGIVVDGPRGTETIACDGVVFTAGWIPEVAAVATGPVKVDGQTGGLAVNRAGLTNVPGVFAAGNVLSPLKASGSCAIQGRRVGLSVAKYLGSQS
ncbi:FAD-dependent oxidoreductase [Hyphomicrobium facile]|uniref:Thioredoxin reductase n=1 Tax=Hyphomicrobium facile TaxID=51670 RepID=A0A1I7N4C4_9HYPH|nr:FAD-dependent oxidoreductase [Hyphomicrobium facile]SFV29504.1 Thioredoxin reductase [Hyphomicrobium facile]